MKESGILMPVFSLPGSFGIGRLGEDAKKFINFLANAGVNYWQMLPVNPVRAGASPYQAPSAFAGNPLYICPLWLCENEYLKKDELQNFIVPGGRVNYFLVEKQNQNILELAFARFTATAPPELYIQFCKDNSGWLTPWVNYAAKEAAYGPNFENWPGAQCNFAATTAGNNTVNGGGQIPAIQQNFHALCQYVFFMQWRVMRAYAAAKGVKLIGDMPLYVSAASADVYSNKNLFLQGDGGGKGPVAGCPPDAFSAEGQLWNNPLYNWPEHEKTDFLWWKSRLAQAKNMFDMARLDHFRGLESYWAVPAGAKTAVEGAWQPGPGLSFLQAIKGHGSTHLPLIAEDLGDITHAVHALRQAAGLPGMRVLQFAFEPNGQSSYLPHRHEENCVVYTGTHDNNTFEGWVQTGGREEVEFACRYLNTEKENLTAAAVAAALESVAQLAVIPLQDYLTLGANTRINTPGTVSSANWSWRLEEDYLTIKNAAKIKAALVRAGRAKG